MLSRSPIVALILIASASLLSPAGIVSTEHERIVEVTVYPDRAEVVREAKLPVPRGSSSLEFAGIPDGVEPDSLRVAGKGVRAALGAVELQERIEVPVESPDLAAATLEADRIQTETAALDAEESVAKDLREYLASVRAMASQKAGEKQAEGRPDPAAINAFYALLQARLQEQSREALVRKTKRESLQKQMAVAQARIAAARPAGSIRTRVAAVEVETEEAGTLAVRLTYVVPGASWHPAYRASLEPATGTVSLVSEAVVRQTTGEDWGGVSLRLSTASPARSVVPPVLGSWLLRPQLFALAAASGRSGAGVERLGARGGAVVGLDGAPGFTDMFVEDMAVLGHSYQNVLTLAPGINDANGDGHPDLHGGRERDFAWAVDGVSRIDPLTGTFMSNIHPDAIADMEVVIGAAASSFAQGVGAEGLTGASSAFPTAGAGASAASPPPTASTTLESSLVHSAYDVTFEVPGRSEVPADGRDHRVVLRKESLDGTIEHRTVPGLLPQVFVVARTHAPDGYPLLAGPLRVSTADSYAGSYPIPETAPGAELSIPFGVDKRISVVRTSLPRTGLREGLMGKERKIGYTFRTTLENLRDRSVQLIVQDRLPVSEDERIEVEPGKGTTPGYTEVKDRPGIIEWTVPLAPREKREVVLSYSVRVPKEIAVGSAIPSR